MKLHPSVNQMASGFGNGVSFRSSQAEWERFRAVKHLSSSWVDGSGRRVGVRVGVEVAYCRV